MTKDEANIIRKEKLLDKLDGMKMTGVVPGTTYPTNYKALIYSFINDIEDEEDT